METKLECNICGSRSVPLIGNNIYRCDCCKSQCIDGKWTDGFELAISDAQDELVKRYEYYKAKEEELLAQYEPINTPKQVSSARYYILATLLLTSIALGLAYIAATFGLVPALGVGILIAIILCTLTTRL
jgi:hypothetical protein